MALLPPVFVELRANASEFMAAMDEANKKVVELGDKGVSTGQKIKEHLGAGLAAGGAGATAAGGLLLEMGEKLEQSHKQLEQAIGNTGHAYDEYSGQIAQTVNHMENLNHGAADTNTALQKLTTASQDPKKALADMALVADIAAAKHISLSDAAAQVVKMHAGAAKSFKEFGVIVTDTEKATGNYSASMDEVARRVKGQGEAAVDSFGGHLAVLKTHLLDVASSLGEKVGPALTVAGPLMMGLGGIVQSGVIPMVANAVTGFAEMAAGALAAFASMVAEAAVWAASMVASAAVAFAPFLPIVAVVAAVGVAAWELYQHWDEVWGFIKGVVSSAFDFVKDHMDLIIAVALGPVGIAIDLLKDHWAQVWGAIKGAVTGAWDVIKGVVGGGIGFVKDLFVREVNGWKAIWDAVWGGMKEGVEKVWGGITGTVKGGINALIDGLNVLIRALDSIQIHIPSVGVGPFHTPGFDWDGLNLKEIPELRAMGGPVQAGMPYIVGEKRPELFVPSSNGRIEPSVPGGNVTNISLTVNAGMGTDGAALGRTVVSALREYMRQNGPVPITTRVA